jgi:hypothetical protein
MTRLRHLALVGRIWSKAKFDRLVLARHRLANYPQSASKFLRARGSSGVIGSRLRGCFFFELTT